MSEDEVKLLTIKSLQRNDTGTYLCRVLNEYGFTDLIHYLNVLPGKEICSLIFFFKYFSLKVSERPSLLKKISSNKRHYFYNRFPDEIIILIVCVIAILLFAFVFFLIYHFRNEKSLRQTLLATRILATRSINNLKNVSSNYFIEFSNIFHYE